MTEPNCPNCQRPIAELDAVRKQIAPSRWPEAILDLLARLARAEEVIRTARQVMQQIDARGTTVTAYPLRDALRAYDRVGDEWVSESHIRDMSPSASAMGAK